MERCVGRISEAAYRLGEQAVVLVPDQPWHDIRGMGNHLRHGYDRISTSIVWDMVCEELPSLFCDAREALERLLRDRGTED